MESEILFNVLTGKYGAIGEIVLNRPKMLNALSQTMLMAMQQQLDTWQQDPQIKAVVIRGAGDRAFCAGGDIRAIYQLRDQPELARQFFWHEYRLNRSIYHLQKPYIALLDGLTMGGGAGVSINGRYRIGTEKLTLAMPETGIGFFTDVGASYFLSRCRDHVGWYLGLTGTMIDVADAIYAGLVTAQLPSDQLPAFVQALLDDRWQGDLFQCVDAIIANFSVPTKTAELENHAAIIANCFAKDSMQAIVESLEQQTDAWAQQVAAGLKTRSPISLHVVLEALNRGQHMDFDACMQMEYRICQQFLHTPDFFEGVRAAVIDKDRAPRWQPNDLALIKPEAIAPYFTASSSKLL